MSGFPVRPSRASFGPTLTDTSPVRDPSKQVPAAALNLAFWQIAGMGLVAPRGIIKATVDPGATSVTTVAQALAFDPDGAVPLATWTWTSTGQYTWHLSSASYPDEAGTSRALSWLFMVALPVGVSNGTGKPMLPWVQFMGSSLAADSGYVQLVQAEDASTPDDPDQGLVVLLW